MTDYAIRSLHSDDDLAIELDALLDSRLADRAYNLSLAQYMGLVRLRSPLIFGGAMTRKAWRRTREALYLSSHSDIEPDMVRAGVDAITRVFEIIQPDPTAPAPKSHIPVHSPEWVADLIAAGLSAGLDYHQCVYGNMVTLLHIIAAVHRRNGGRTARPDNQDDIAAALRMLKKEEGHDRED